MAAITPYLNFDGNTEEAFNFYRSVFGGDFTAVMRFKEAACGGIELSAEDAEKIAHICLPIGANSVLMATDALESMGRRLTPGNNYYVNINAEDEAEARRLYDGLSDGGTIEMPLDVAFWGGLFGCLTDRFGVQWMVNCEGTGSGAQDA